ncbi:MAG: 4Fe-4S binding protein [Candidatus Nanohaloarchaea archaeon]|nr:4Fe-4S binding protein [Candidatus Nanohaloarchaea archaeon]
MELQRVFTEIKWKKFYPVPLLFILFTFLGFVVPMLRSLGLPIPSLLSLPYVAELAAMLGLYSSQDLFVFMTWIVWWPAFIISIFIFRRLWCGGFCPFGIATDVGNWIREKVGVESVEVPSFLENKLQYLIFPGAAIFVVIGYLHDAINITNSAILTAEFVVFFFLMSFATGVLLPKRGFCRLLCFVGSLPRLFGRLAFMGLKTDTEKCMNCAGKWCMKGPDAPPPGISTEKRPLLGTDDGCPTNVDIPALGSNESNRDCLDCGNCMKNCPYDAIHYTWTIPGDELVKGIDLDLGETVGILLILGILSMFASMEGGLLGQAAQWLGLSSHWVISGIFTLAMTAAVFLLYCGACYLTSRLFDADFGRTSRILGYGFLPFVFLAFARDIIVTYLIMGSKLSTLIPTAVIPFIDSTFIIVGAAWALLMIVWLGRHLTEAGRMPTGRFIAGVSPLLVFVVLLAVYWITTLYPLHLTQLAGAGIAAYWPIAIGLASGTIVVVALHKKYSGIAGVRLPFQ